MVRRALCLLTEHQSHRTTKCMYGVRTTQCELLIYFANIRSIYAHVYLCWLIGLWYAQIITFRCETLLQITFVHFARSQSHNVQNIQQNDYDKQTPKFSSHFCFRFVQCVCTTFSLDYVQLVNVTFTANA